MRLALISQEYPPETAKGGLGTQTYLKAHGLAQRGHEVFVISRSVDGTQREYFDGSVHVTRIPGFETRTPLYTEIADWITYSAQVAAAITERHAASALDLLDFAEWGAEGYVHLINQTEWNHIPSVVQLHGPLVLFAHAMHWPAIDSEFYRTGTMMEATCLRLADAIYTSSRYSAEFVQREYRIACQSAPVIHTGVDTELFAPGRAPLSTSPTIVFAGKLVPNKGVFSLLQAALELANELPDLRLLLLGKATETVARELHRRAAATGRTNLLQLGGFIARDQLPAQLCRGHVFAAPAPHEPGPGLVYLEAMACGLPVIACEGSGAAEVVLHEKTGLLVPPNDHGALVAALRQLLTQPGVRAAMSERARQFAVEQADSNLCLNRLEHFYESIVQRTAALV